jgi:hypothetical protein
MIENTLVLIAGKWLWWLGDLITLRDGVMCMFQLRCSANRGNVDFLSNSSTWSSILFAASDLLQ